MQAVVSEGLINKTELVRDIIKPTRRRKRFFNYIVDGIFLYMVSFVVDIIWSSTILITGDNYYVNNIPMIITVSLIKILIMIIYYITFENIFGKTIGKMATNTKVVRADGTKPTLNALIARNLIRFIPFEPLSLLFSHLPRGWHDSLSKTIVIDDISLYSIEKPKEKLEESF